MRASFILLLASGCNFLTEDLEDQAPVRGLSVPEEVSKYGHALAALPAGNCGASGALVVAGQGTDGPSLYLVTFGEAGGASTNRINNREGTLSAAEEIVAMDPGEDAMTLNIETNLRQVQVIVDSDCDDMEDTACADYCFVADLTDQPITGAEDEVRLFGGDAVTVTGNPGASTVTVAGHGAVQIPEDVSGNQLGLAVARVPFDGPSGVTEELAVGGTRSAILFFRTGLDGDCDPREGAPTDVACE